MKKQTHINDDDSINPDLINDLETVCTEKKTGNMFTKLLSGEYFKKPTYSKLKSLFIRVEEFYLELKHIFEKVQIEKYMSETIDTEQLKEIFKAKGLGKNTRAQSWLAKQKTKSAKTIKQQICPQQILWFTF